MAFPRKHTVWRLWQALLNKVKGVSEEDFPYPTGTPTTMLLARIALREAFVKLRGLNASMSLALLLRDKKKSRYSKWGGLWYIPLSMAQTKIINMSLPLLSFTTEFCNSGDHNSCVTCFLNVLDTGYTKITSQHISTLLETFPCMKSSKSYLKDTGDLLRLRQIHSWTWREAAIRVRRQSEKIRCV